MLHCTMKHPTQSLKLCLEDLLADLWHARRSGDLGRLALVCYYEVRRWARLADEPELAEQASALMMRTPHTDRASFMADVDRLIAELEQLHKSHQLAPWASADAALVAGHDAAMARQASVGASDDPRR